MHILSRDAQLLIVRLFFIVLATSALYSIWDNYEFILRFPFYILAVLELAFGCALLFVAYAPKKFPQHGALILLVSYWVYSIAVSIGSSLFYVYHLGLTNIVSEKGQSIPVYLTIEALYVIILPSLAFGFIVWIAHRLRL